MYTLKDKLLGQGKIINDMLLSTANYIEDLETRTHEAEDLFLQLCARLGGFDCPLIRKAGACLSCSHTDETQRIATGFLRLLDLLGVKKEEIGSRFVGQYRSAWEDIVAQQYPNECISFSDLAKALQKCLTDCAE